MRVRTGALLVILFLWQYTVEGGTYNVEKKIDESLRTDHPIFVSLPLLAADYDQNNIIVDRFLEQQKNSYIVFIHDHENKNYIVKQDRGISLEEQFRAICETVASAVARELSIPAHEVQLIPVNQPFPGKFMIDRLATLHTVVPGRTVRSLKHVRYARIDIKQSIHKNISFSQRGLTGKTVSSMALHPQLPSIVALDTFLSNKDRNKANFLYDEDSDTFYCIDMSLIYDYFEEKQSVAHVACQQVMAMIEEKKEFSQEEKDALVAYRLMLQELVKKFPPRRIYFLFETLVCDSGLLQNSSRYDHTAITDLLGLYKKAIKQSYSQTKKLIYLLSVLIHS